MPPPEMFFSDTAAPLGSRAEVWAGNPHSQPVTLAQPLEPPGLWFPSDSPPPPTAAQAFYQKRTQGSWSSLERPHQCTALLASLLLNINNDISIVCNKLKKELQEHWVEVATRIMRPLQALE